MNEANEPSAEAVAEAPEPTMSPVARATAVFVNPGQAWGGLKAKAQWWFPMLVMTALGVLLVVALFDRVLVPTEIDRIDVQIASGDITAEQGEQAIAFVDGPMGMVAYIIGTFVMTPLSMLLAALVVWFGVGFVLGTRMSFRLALEVSTWASFISVVPQLLASGLAWARGSMLHVSVGFGGLLPPNDSPTKLETALRVFLDALGPLAIWYLVVGIIGAATLSGEKRKNVGWVLGILYVAIAVFMSALAAMFAPGS